MVRFGSGPSLAAVLAMLALTSVVAHAKSDPPARGARLGLAIHNLDEAWRESNAYQSSGVMVVGVDPRGRAAGSGIVAGDVLVSVDGRTIREPSDLGDAERTLSPDKAVSVVLAREGGRLIKMFKIAPVGAPPAVAVEPTAAADQWAIDPAADPAPSAVDPASDSVPPVVAATSAAADTATPPAASSTSVLETEQATVQKSAASDGAPSLTAAGTGESPAGTGGEVSALTAPAAIAAGGVASALVEPGASPATTAMVDSGGAPLDSVGPAPAELGVVGKSLTPDLASALGASGVEGILVLEVVAESPADRSGLRAGDIILKVGERPVADMGEFNRAAAASPTPVPISTLRLGKPKVELVSLDGPPPTPFPPPSQEQLLMELREEVRSLRREVQGLRKKLGK